MFIKLGEIENARSRTCRKWKFLPRSIVRVDGSHDCSDFVRYISRTGQMENGFKENGKKESCIDSSEHEVST